MDNSDVEKIMPLVRYLIIASVFLLAGCNLGSHEASLDEPSIITTATEFIEFTQQTDSTVTEVPIASDNAEATSAPPEPIISAETSVDMTDCTVRSDWFTYRVVTGDTLSSIATRTQSTVLTLLDANCLSNANLITAGQQLYVPNQVTVASQSQNDTGDCTVTAIQDAQIFPLFGGTSGVPIGTLSQGQSVVIEIEAPTGYWGYKNGMNNGNYVWLDPRQVTTPMGDCDDLLTMFDIRDQHNDAGTNSGEQNQVVYPNSFDVQPRTVPRGGTLTISWNFEGNISDVEIGAEEAAYRGRITLASG